MAIVQAEVFHDEEYILTCALCRGRFDHPKELPCLHTFCRGCLERHVGGKTVTFNCPTCHRITVVPKAGVDGFLNNRHINSLVQLNELFRGGDSHPVCQFCASKETATSWCQDCSSFLCKSCHDRATRIYQGTRFYTLEECCDPTEYKAMFRKNIPGGSTDEAATLDCLCMMEERRDSDADVLDHKVTDVTSSMDASDTNCQLSE
ncbi:TRIM3 [Branchiostoma lanceolatum]|uniref:TRIM3 protein n=1 Tax=Branchiostoma lanceolatum TaxID=7740 RepID=A0A8K0E9Q6_BRALA|nr:TRIM3 [Branchiostoma lanceolatum]